MSYAADKIRNICLLGHGGDGKTSLAESILYLTKGTDRLGKVTDGNTVCDSDPEEIRRRFSISSAMAPTEYKNYKINFIDTPGFFDFVGEVRQGIRVADAGLIVLTAKNGVAVGTEKSWKYVNERNLPRLFYISKMDEENADFVATANALRDAFGSSVCPIMLPIVEGGKMAGYVDIAKNKAYKFDGKAYAEIAVPGDLEDQVEEYRMNLTEAIAETDDDLMEKFFAEEPFTDEEYVTGIKNGVATGVLAPVVCGCYTTGFGTLPLLDTVINYVPSPLEAAAEKGEDANGDAVELKADPNGPTVAFVFKTVTDQYGRFSFFKVVSGKVTSDMTLVNARTGENEKIGHIYMVRGKKNTEVTEVGLGDIGAVSKLNDTKTNDTLCAAGKVVELEKIVFDEPCYTRAIYPKAKGGEEKIASGLTKLKDEDPAFTSGPDPETHEFVVSGAGDMHIDVLCSKLKTKFGADVELADPKVAYREKIRKKVRVQGKHKKQSGGHGQYGDVWIEFEPNIEQDEMVFAENVFGGSVPKNFFPAVEKGLRDCMDRGVLAGYPVVQLKATLVDGSYHDVDSNEMSFKMAARLAFKAGIPQANPVLMEPIGSLKVFIPDSNMGDIIGDLNKRRGRVMGMNPGNDGQTTVEAEVPMAEMATYAIDLRSMTQGRGSFSLKFERYEDAPPMVQQKVIEEAKANMVEDDD
ncbi:MAG: elongation factor G [Ruminococcaceae bacterium]|nr:elongation factor G [Oscillospiraceae bacterium]